MKVLCCGDRNWKNDRAIWRELCALPAGTTIIHGNCAGADVICAKLAHKLGFKVIMVWADWEREGKAAGPIRNQRMLDIHHPDLVLAFHRFIAKSKGTKDMVDRAYKAGVPVKIVKE